MTIVSDVDGVVTYKPVHQALVGVMADMKGIAKDGVNQHQHYKFRGIDQCMDALHDPLVKHGVLMLPHYTLLSEEDRETTNAQGELKYSRFVSVQATYTFVGPAGDTLEVQFIGSASDTADKATNQAMAAALKYAILQSFMVPVGDGDSDEKTDEMAGAGENRRSRQAGNSAVLTDPQFKALQKAHAARNLDFFAETQKRWGKDPDKLTKPEASRFLDELNGKTKPPSEESVGNGAPL